MHQGRAIEKSPRDEKWLFTSWETFQSPQAVGDRYCTLRSARRELWFTSFLSCAAVQDTFARSNDCHDPYQQCRLWEACAGANREECQRDALLGRIDTHLPTARPNRLSGQFQRSGGPGLSWPRQQCQPARASLRNVPPL